MPKINLTIGDYSGDGHDKSDKYLIESNLSLSELKQAYEIGTEKVGFDFYRTVAEAYEDNYISIEQLSILKNLGFGDLFDEPYCKGSEKIRLEAEEYVNIFLFICKLGNEQFEHEFISDNSDNWNIGGYGLFY